MISSTLSEENYTTAKKSGWKTIIVDQIPWKSSHFLSFFAFIYKFSTLFSVCQSGTNLLHDLQDNHE